MQKSSDAFRIMGEVSKWLEVPSHVIRFWENKFPDHIKPVQRVGGRRYFRPDDMKVLSGLKNLLHTQGLTIRSVQKMIAEDGIEVVTKLSMPIPGHSKKEATKDGGDPSAPRKNGFEDKFSGISLEFEEETSQFKGATEKRADQSPDTKEQILRLDPKADGKAADDQSDEKAAKPPRTVEILEPDHKWHLKIDQGHSTSQLRKAVAKLSALRDEMARKISD